MNEIKTPPELGSREAAVRSIVNLISLATHTDEDKLAYWLDAYYQAREAFEKDRKIDFLPIQSPADYSPDDIFDKVRYAMKRNALTTDDGPSRTPAPTEKPEGGRQIAAPTEADEDDVTDNNVGNKSPEAEDPTPVMRGRETIKLQERVKSESRSESMRKQKAAEREFKMRVADRLRDLRAQGLRTGDIVRISGGNVTDSAVLSILDGQFRPIADYRALDAALEKCAEEIQKGVTGT